MKRILGIVTVLLVLALNAGAEVHNYTIEVGQFDKIKVSDNVNVVYRCLPDSTGFVQYSGEKEFADAFIITPKSDGTLRIQVSTEDVGHPDLPTLFIYSDFLTSVSNSSDFSLLVENPAPCAEFKAVQVGNGSVAVENIKTNKLSATLNTGNGTVNISGSAVTAVLKIVGTGIISADRLEADVVKCQILGGGSIGCWPNEMLSVKGVGSTKIYYKGDPKIKKSGGGKLLPLPQERHADTVVYDDDDYDTSDDVISPAENTDAYNFQQKDLEEENEEIEEVEETTVVEAEE